MCFVHHGQFFWIAYCCNLMLYLSSTFKIVEKIDGFKNFSATLSPLNPDQ